MGFGVGAGFGVGDGVGLPPMIPTFALVTTGPILQRPMDEHESDFGGGLPRAAYPLGERWYTVVPSVAYTFPFGHRMMPPL